MRFNFGLTVVWVLLFVIDAVDVVVLLFADIVALRIMSWTTEHVLVILVGFVLCA